jgi:hypothetical protein
MDDVRIMRRSQRKMRIVIEGIGVIDIDRGLHTSDGKPRVRVDVISDFDRFGPSPDGLAYSVENGHPGPGVVFLTGQQPAPPVSADTERAKGNRDFELCADGCGKHVNHKVNGDPECGPR